jgi:hypothetical protein
VDSELESFKTNIDLRAYAAAEGYLEDKRYSSKACFCMRHPATDDKIFIGLDQKNRHYVYWSVRDDADKGSIIDFVAHRKRIDLRDRKAWRSIGEELRPWIGRPAVSMPAFAPLVPTTKDRITVEAKFAEMHVALRHEYLLNERAVPPSLLALDRFAGRVRIDNRGNAVFPHFDAHGLSGYEIKNTAFTGFSPGGTKGLWLSREEAFDNCLVFCESAIDALSYAVLFPDDRTRYASIGGKPNPVQPKLIGAAVKRMPKYSKIVAAMDADADGGKLAEVVREAVQLSQREDLVFLFQEPFGFNDWNDQLRGNHPDRSPVVRALGLDMR